MSDVSVEFGAVDVGLEKTLKAVQAEMTTLQTKIKSGDLAFGELEQTMKKLGQAEGLEKKLQAMGTDAAGTSPKIDALGGDLKAMGAKAEDAGEKGHMSLGKIGIAAGVAGAAVKVGMLAVEAAFAAANGVINAFGSAITQAADFQQLETSFNVLIGNTTLAKTFLEDLSNFAASTPFTIPGLADASKTLLSFGVMSSEVIPIVSMLGDVAQGNEDKLKSLALAFGKVESQGKLTGEELNQMIDSGFNPLDTISQKTGKSMGELRKEMEKGSITSSMIREAFVSATSEGGKFFEMTKKQGLTFKGVMSTMQDAVDELYRRFGKPVIEALTPIIQKWSERIAEIAPLFSEIGAAVANTITFFSDLVDKVLNVDTAVSNLGSSISAISGGEYAAGIENLFLSMKVWAMETGNEIYKHMIAAFKTVAEFAGSIFDPSGALGKTVVDSFEYIGTKAAVTIMRTLAQGLAGSSWTSGIALSLNQAANESNSAANKIADNFAGAGGRISDQFTAAGAALPKSFAENYGAIPPLFDDIKTSQDQIDANNAKIAASTKDIVLSDQEAVAEARAYFDQWKKSNDLKEAAIARALEENKIKSEALQFELDLATAKATGNAAEQKALEERKVWLEAWKKATESGMGEANANAFADAMLRTKQITDSITGKDIIVTVTTKVEDTRFKTLLAEINSATATQHSIELALKVTGQTDLVGARTILGLMESKNIEVGMKTAGVESVENLQNVLYSLPTQKDVDLAIKLTGKDDWKSAAAEVKNLAPTKEVLLTLKEQGFASLQEYKDSITSIGNGATAEIVAKDMGGSLANVQAAVYAILESGKTPTEVKVSATADTTAAQASIAELGVNPVNLVAKFDMAAFADSLASLKSAAAAAFSEPFKLNLTDSLPSFGSGTTPMPEPPASDTSIFSELKNLVSDIKTLVGKIEPKLPQVALAV